MCKASASLAPLFEGQIEITDRDDSDHSIGRLKVSLLRYHTGLRVNLEALLALRMRTRMRMRTSE